MTNINCRLCLNDCLRENLINIFDDELDVKIPQLVVKYLLIVIENDLSENFSNAPKKFSTKICRMCFVHLLDFHYFFELITQRQKLLHITPKLETIDILSDSEDNVDEQKVFCFLDTVSEKSDEYFSIINEADKNSVNVQTNYAAYNTALQLETKENAADDLLKIIDGRLVLDPNLMENKFIYDDDSDLESQPNSAIKGNVEQNNEYGVKARKRKRINETNVCYNTSIEETIIKLRQRTNNISDVVDKNGHLRNCTRNTVTRQSSKISITPETRSYRSYNKVCRLKMKKSNIKRTRSDKMTYEIIARNGQLKCDVCQAEQKTFAELVRHFHKKHIHLRPFAVCCDKRHYSPKVLANHILGHSNPDLFKCEICGKILGTQYSYRSHKRTKHSGKRKAYKCNICGKRLISAKYFDVHVSNHT